VSYGAATGAERWEARYSGPHPTRGAVDPAAIAVLERIEGASRRTRVVRAIAAAPALALTGQTAEALKVAEAATRTTWR
jgi:hypothetical protein